MQGITRRKPLFFLVKGSTEDDMASFKWICDNYRVGKKRKLSFALEFNLEIRIYSQEECDRQFRRLAVSGFMKNRRIVSLDGDSIPGGI